MSRYRADDPNTLVPTFRVEVESVLATLRERGFDPVLFDARRTFAEAARNAARGTGSALSVHCWGVAADVICGSHGWGCKAAGCEFFSALGVAVKARGLVWGGDWRKRDLPHFQCITVAQQRALRAFAPEDIGRVDAFVAKCLSKRSVA